MPVFFARESRLTPLARDVKFKGVPLKSGCLERLLRGRAACRRATPNPSGAPRDVGRTGSVEFFSATQHEKAEHNIAPPFLRHTLARCPQTSSTEAQALAQLG